MSRLVVVSNRVGPLSDEGKAGGLAVGLADALRTRGGVWFGWSGEETPQGTFGPLHLATEGDVSLATVDLTPADLQEFYSGYANQTLWPILHYRIDLATFDRRFVQAYQRVNDRMADRLKPLLRSGDIVWVHDYHFIPLGERLRRIGHEGPLGFFLHVPFPAPEVVTALPDVHALVRSMLEYDLIGFQTKTDCDNFRRFVIAEFAGKYSDDGRLEAGGRRLRIGAFPIGIDADRFAEFATSPEAKRRETQIRNLLRDRMQIIGVDRLDYSKGIPERFRAFDRLLSDYPDNCGRVSLLQVAPLSRSDLGAYSDLRRELEELAGHINGTHAHLDWTPIRIITRGFARKSLSGIYRASRVGLVTPLRDGMNLVAKEYIAAQNPEDPGALVLSRFAGAANELTEALIVNPHNAAEVADALQRAIIMPLEERQERWAAMFAKIRAGSAEHWCEQFLSALEGGEMPSSDRAGQADDASKKIVRVPRFRPVGPVDGATARTTAE